MHLVALVESPEHVCCRYRVSAFRPWLEENGHRLDLCSLPRRCWSRLRLARILRRADVVILQRKLLPLWQLYLLRSVSRRLVFDFDDAVFLRDSYSPKGLHSVRRLHRFIATLETVDRVAAGNGYLAGQAERWKMPRHVRVIPTCVEPARYSLAQHRHQGDGIELVWVGSSSTLQGLESIKPLLEELGQQVSGIRLKLVCDRFLTLRHLPVVCCPWSEQKEVEAIATADIGISWLVDDLWSRGKCGLKVLQYMAAGLPVVANPVGMHTDLVREGQTGYLPHTPAEWIEAVRRLAQDVELRRAWGRPGASVWRRTIAWPPARPAGEICSNRFNSPCPIRMQHERQPASGGRSQSQRPVLGRSGRVPRSVLQRGGIPVEGMAPGGPGPDRQARTAPHGSSHPSARPGHPRQAFPHARLADLAARVYSAEQGPVGVQALPGGGRPGHSNRHSPGDRRPRPGHSRRKLSDNS